MPTIEEDFQSFADKFDRLEEIAVACRLKAGSGKGDLPVGVTISKPEADNSGVLVESLREPIKGVGTGKVVFFTLRDYPPGGAFLNVYLHTDRDTMVQVQDLLAKRPHALGEVVTSYGHDHLLSKDKMCVTSFFPAMIDNPKAAYACYSGDIDRDMKMLSRNPDPAEIEFLGAIVNSLRTKLLYFLEK